MRVSTLVPFIGVALAGPLTQRSMGMFPLSDGFPNPSDAQLKAIEKAAGGTIPNGNPLATYLTPSAAVTWQLVALNEIFEVSYFNNLLSRLHCGGNGAWSPSDCQFARDTFTAIRAQEELHAIGANAILKTAGQKTVDPCNFAFPPTSYNAAVALANTFTDVVLSVLPVAQLAQAKDNNDELPYVQLIGTVIAQEGEQNGWFRSQQRKVPSAAPFLTTSGPSFAFSFLKGVIIGSCPAVDMIAKSVPSYPPLTVVHAIKSWATFSVKGYVNLRGHSIVYLTGGNAPITEQIRNVSYDQRSGMTVFSAALNFDEDGFSKGLTVAAVVKGTGKFADVNAVAAATVYGPGIIEIQ